MNVPLQYGSPCVDLLNYRPMKKTHGVERKAILVPKDSLLMGSDPTMYLLLVLPRSKIAEWTGARALGSESPGFKS